MCVTLQLKFVNKFQKTEIIGFELMIFYGMGHQDSHYHHL